MPDESNNDQIVLVVEDGKAGQPLVRIATRTATYRCWPDVWWFEEYQEPRHLWLVRDREPRWAGDLTAFAARENLTTDIAERLIHELQAS